MTTLITGHRGFIGRNMMKALPGSVGYEWGDGSVSLDGITRVIHLGAISSTACNDEQQLQKQNIDFSIDLLNACTSRRIPFQFASSASIYGPNATTFKETDEPDPKTPYARSKHAVEQYILSRNWPVPVQAFRYFNVYGPYEEHKDQPSPHTRFRMQAQLTGKIKIFEGSEDIYRDFVSVEQVVKVHKHFFDLEVSGVYNLGTGRVKSFAEVARDIASDTGSEIIEVPMPHLIGYQRYTCADMTKTNALF